jgi:hypothetical protein
VLTMGQWGDRGEGICQGLTGVVSRGPPIEQDRGLMPRQR